MSACISRQGEFSEHVPLTGGTEDRFTCSRCYVLDVDALIAAYDALRDAAQYLVRCYGHVQDDEMSLGQSNAWLRVKDALCKPVQP